MSSEQNTSQRTKKAMPRPGFAGGATAVASPLPTTPLSARDTRDTSADDATTAQSPLYLFLLIGGLLVGALLLFVQPLAKPTWTDEVISIVWGERPLADILLSRATSADALPLHPLLIHTTHALFGDSLTAFRIASALPSAIGLWFVYLLGRRFSPKVGLLALWLCALSPGLILYDRMARYHGLTALLATMSVWATLRLLDTGKVRDAILYTVITWLMLMSYFLSLFVIVAEVGFLLLLWNREPVSRYRWYLVAAAGVAFIAFAPFLINGVLKASNSGMTKIAVEDPAVGQGARGFLLRFALPAYVFCVGETVYPWTWFISLPGIVAAVGAFLLGARALWRERRIEILIPLTCFLVLLISALATSGKFGAGQTVGSMAKRVSFALPLFYVTLSVGVFSLLNSATPWRRPWGIALAAVLTAVSLYSVRNYWTGQQFLNPNYTAPWGEAIAKMQSVQPLGADTYVFSRGELTLDFLLKGSSVEGMGTAVGYPFDNQVADISDISRDLAAHPGIHYVWIVGRDRGDRPAVDAFNRISDALKSRYHYIGTYGVMPRTESEMYWFKKVMKRDATPNYIWMELFDISQPADAAPAGGAK